MLYVNLLDYKKESICALELDFTQEVMLNWGNEFMNWHSRWCDNDIEPLIKVDTVTLIINFLCDKR